MEIYIKKLNNKSLIKKLINKYLLNWKEESSIIFAQIIKEYLRNFFSKESYLHHEIKKYKYYIETVYLIIINLKYSYLLNHENRSDPFS